MSNSIRSLRFAVLLSVMGVALSACSGASPQISYYTLIDSADIAQTTAPQSSPFVLNVGPVKLPGILNEVQIATGGTDGRYQLSEYHRWAGEFDREFARALAEQLAVRLGTTQVYVFPVNPSLQPTLQVLIDILEMNGELGKEARLAVRWTLIDPKGKEGAVSRLNSFNQQLTANSHDAWVRAQRRNIYLLSLEIAAHIKQQTGSGRAM